MLRQRGKKANPSQPKTFIVPNIISLTLQDLPVEMMEEIFSYLFDASALLKASWVCKLHREIIYKKFGPALLDFQIAIDEERRLHGCLPFIMCKTAVFSEFYGTMLSVSCLNISGCNTSAAMIANDNTQEANDPTIQSDKTIVTNNGFAFFAEFKEKTTPLVEHENANNEYLLTYTLN